MSAGSFGAGLGPAGADPAPSPSPAFSTSPTPRAEKFDPSTRRFVMNTDGTVADVHPVDQAFVLAWTTPARAIPCAPKVGRDLAAVTSTLDPQLAAKVDTAMRAAVQPFVDAKDAVVLSTNANNPRSAPGRLETLGNYQNLRTKAVQNR